MAAKIARIYCLVLAIFALTACGGDPLDDQIARQEQLTKQQMQLLDQQLQRGQVRNANLINSYADIVAADDPKLAPLLDQLKQDASVNGMLFQNLQRRWQDVNNNPDAFASKQARLAELSSIYQAADPLVFNDMLADSLNVIADLSKGALPRVSGESLATSLAANNASDYGSGSELVGNPNYGNWQTNSSGHSFWAWYGMYSMFNNLMSPRIGYDDWSRHRNYSYYSDRGRNTYRSPQQRNSDNKFEQKIKKSFSRNDSYQSPYAKQRNSNVRDVNKQRYQSSRQTATSRNNNKSFRATNGARRVNDNNKFSRSTSAKKSSYSTGRSSKSSRKFRVKRRRR